MKKITQYKTHDNELHKTQKQAEEHLQKLFDNKLFEAARQIENVVLNNGHTAICQFICNNLKRFAELNNIKQDMNLTDDNGKIIFEGDK